jgi:hypothetical protein
LEICEGIFCRRIFLFKRDLSKKAGKMRNSENRKPKPVCRQAGKIEIAKNENRNKAQTGVFFCCLPRCLNVGLRSGFASLPVTSYRVIHSLAPSVPSCYRHFQICGLSHFYTFTLSFFHTLYQPQPPCLPKF